MGKPDAKEPSFGKIMTSLLIPKDSRSNPRRVLSGIAFLAFVLFFLVAALGRGCQQPPADPAGQAVHNAPQSTASGE